MVKVLALIEEEADMNAVDSIGLTSLHVACVNGRLEVAMALIDRGADINARDNSGSTIISSIYISTSVYQSHGYFKTTIHTGNMKGRESNTIYSIHICFFFD